MKASVYDFSDTGGGLRRRPRSNFIDKGGGVDMCVFDFDFDVKKSQNVGAGRGGTISDCADCRGDFARCCHSLDVFLACEVPKARRGDV